MITPYPEEDEDIDEYKEKNVYLLINGALQGAEFDEHTVNFMKVPCNESRVEIYEEVLDNDTFDEKEASAVQKVLENKSMNRRKLLEQHPVEDVDNPGHYRTFLDLLASGRMDLNPGGQLDGVRRCKVSIASSPKHLFQGT